MQFLRLCLPGIAAILTAPSYVSTTAIPHGPAIEMNFFDDRKCSSFNTYRPTYVYGDLSCSPFNNTALLVNYYNHECAR
jgi:hypothetical protein